MRSTLLPNNVGTTDRAVRALVGVAVLALAFVGPKTIWGFVGLIPLFTALAGSCPAYTVLGISTCPAKARR